MRKSFTLIVIFLVCMSCFAQVFESDYFQNNPGLGGDVVIKSSSIQVNEEKEEIIKIFEVESFEEGAYYMDSWIMAPLVNESYPEYKVEVNGILSGLTFKPQTDGWHSLTLTDNKSAATIIHLKKGINTISVIGKGAAVPAVEFIKLSSSFSNTGISDTNYRKFVDDVKSGALNEAYTRNSMQAASINSFNQPEYSYDYRLHYPKNYTEWKSFHCYSGSSFEILTDAYSTPCMIYLFSKDEPGTYSWSASSTTGATKLRVTIPKTGTYIALARSLDHLVRGGTDITAKVNNTSYTYNNCMVTNAGLIPVTPGYPTPANFFTCESVYDTWLFLIDSSGCIRDYNKDGGTKSDGYSWGTNPRIETRLPGIKYAMVLNETSYSPHNTVCDVYLGLGLVSPRILEFFPYNMTADNSFKSAPASDDYHCFSWAIGETERRIWPGQTLERCDQYYDSLGYTHVGANAENAAIALWVREPIWNATGYLITHASVRKNSLVPNPHGFEWESKIGYGERVMHTKDALQDLRANENIGDFPYGKIKRYYRVTPYTLRNGLTGTKAFSEIRESSFSTTELNSLATMKNQIPSILLSGFEEKYQLWKNTWKRPEIFIHSNPYMYAESEEYDNLLEYCIPYGKAVWPLLIDKLTGSQNDYFVLNLLRDLTYNRNWDFVDDIAIASGNYSPYIYYNLVDYCKTLLEKEALNMQKSIQNITAIEEESLNIDVRTSRQDILVDMNPSNDGKVSVLVYNFFGGLEYESTHSFSKGSQTIVINASNLKKGIYVVQLTIGGKSISKTVNI